LIAHLDSVATFLIHKFEQTGKRVLRVELKRVCIMWAAAIKENKA